MATTSKKYPKIDYTSTEAAPYVAKYNSMAPYWDQAYAAYIQQNPGVTYDVNEFKRQAYDGLNGPVHKFVLNYTPTVTIDPNKRMSGDIVSTPPNIEGTYIEPTQTSQINTIPVSKTPSDKSWQDDLTYFNPLRMATVFEAVGNVINQDAPDNTLASSIRNAYRPVEYSPFGERASVTPFDWRTFSIAQRAKDRANQQTIVGASGGNNAAALAALAQNNLSRQGDLATSQLQGIEYNNKQNLGVLGFNNALDQANKQAQSQIDQYNMSREMQSLTAAAQVWDQEKKLIEQITSQNKSALANTLSSVGQDYINYSLIKNNPAFLYSPILQNLKQPNTNSNG